MKSKRLNGERMVQYLFGTLSSILLVLGTATGILATQDLNNEELYEQVASMIRITSEAEKLATIEGISGRLTEKKFAEPTRPVPPIELKHLIDNVILANADLKAMVNSKGAQYYYSNRSMSDTYATILAEREANPLL